MARQRIKKDDTVIVIAGKEKGKTGKVVRVFQDKGTLIVERVNVIKRHRKPQGPQSPGGILEKEAPLHLSNVMLFNAATGKGDRVGVKTLGDGRKVRYFKSNGEVVDS